MIRIKNKTRRPIQTRRIAVLKAPNSAQRITLTQRTAYQEKFIQQTFALIAALRLTRKKVLRGVLKKGILIILIYLYLFEICRGNYIRLPAFVLLLSRVQAIRFCAVCSRIYLPACLRLPQIVISSLKLCLCQYYSYDLKAEFNKQVSAGFIHVLHLPAKH